MIKEGGRVYSAEKSGKSREGWDARTGHVFVSSEDGVEKLHPHLLGAKYMDFVCILFCSDNKRLL